jgi:hypothetical protein
MRRSIRGKHRHQSTTHKILLRHHANRTGLINGRPSAIRASVAIVAHQEQVALTNNECFGVVAF